MQHNVKIVLNWLNYDCCQNLTECLRLDAEGFKTFNTKEGALKFTF